MPGMRIGIGTVSFVAFILVSFFHVSSFDLQIKDKDICQNVACFVPGECVGEYERDLVNSAFFYPSCRFVLMIRAFTKSKWRVYIVFNATEFTLKHEDLLFGVKVENDKVVAITGQYKPEIKSQKIGADIVTVEVIIENENDPVFDYHKNRKLEVTLTDNQSSKYWLADQAIVNKEFTLKTFCDPSLIVSNSSTTFKDIEPVNPYYKDLRCQDPSAQALVYIDSSGTSHTDAVVQCDWEDGKEFVYKVTTKTGQIELNNEPFTAFCTILPCTQCTAVSLPSKCDDCMLPTFVKSTSPTTCSELKCPGDDFQIEGKESVVANPICIATEKNESKWSIEGKTFDTATCSGDKQCAKLNPLQISNCDTCDKINATQDLIVCANGAQLRGSYEPDKWLAFASIDCNKITGKWKAITKEGFRKSGIANMTIECYRRPGEVKPNSLFAHISRIGVFGIGICVGVVIVVVIGLGCCCLYRQMMKDLLSEKKDDQKDDKKDEKKDDKKKDDKKDEQVKDIQDKKQGKP